MKPVFFICYLLIITFIAPVVLADENHYCSVFTDDGKMAKRVCGETGFVTFKAHFENQNKPKKFSWTCQSDQSLVLENSNVDRSGKIKLAESPNPIGYLDFFTTETKIVYFWLERTPQKIIPCGTANWFTCQESSASLWLAVSNLNGGELKIKKIKELKDYPFNGIYLAHSPKEIFIAWEGSEDWESFSHPLNVNLSKIDSSLFNFEPEVTISSAEKNKIKDLDSLGSILTENEVFSKKIGQNSLAWIGLQNKVDSITQGDKIYQFSKKAEDDKSSLWLEIEKVTPEEEIVEDTLAEEPEEINTSSKEDSDTKECFYEKPGIYRPTLSVEYEDGTQTVCAPTPVIEVSSQMGCRIRVRQENSNDSYAEKLKLYFGNGIEARIEGDCLEGFSPEWKIFGANPIQNSNDNANLRHVKVLPLAGNEPSVQAEMVNDETEEKIECKEAKIILREKLRWR